MTFTLLLELIKAFQPKDQQEIASFLASNHNNRGKNAQEILRLYQVLLEEISNFSKDTEDKASLYARIFNETEVVPGKLEKVISDLNKLLRTFALTRQYFSEKNEVQQQMDWAKWLRTSGLAEPAQKTILKLKNKNDTSRKESLDQYRIDFLISEEEHIWELTHNQAKGDLNIPGLIFQLDLFYNNYRIELCNRYLLQQKIAQLSDWDFSEAKSASDRSGSVLFQISKTIHDVLKNGFPSTEETLGLMLLLQKHESALAYQTLDHYYAYLRNFCTFLINGGHLEFIPVLHQINQENLQRGYFFLNGKLPPHAYLNMVQIAIRANDTVWAEGFTEDFKSRLVDGDEDQFFYRLNKAHCLFAKRKFEDALDCIPNAPSSIHYHRIVRRLEVKIYYELQSDLLLYKMDAFRKFIERTATKTIASSIRKMEINFINIMMQISQTPRKDKIRVARLISRIEGKEVVADRAWLLEKARELG